MNNMMDISIIDGLEPRDLASHFQRLRADGLDEVEMSNHLLNAVRTKGLRATYTMPVWLSFVQDPLAIVEALRQQFSTKTRRFAIKALGRFLRRPGWKTAWDAIGAVPGLLSLFAELPVSDVAYLLRTIGHCAKGRRYPDRDREITDLFCGLAKSDFPHAVHQSSDQRPLLHRYVHLLPACSSDFIETLLFTKPRFFISSPSSSLLRRHSVPFAKLTRGILFEKHDSKVSLQWILPSVFLELSDGFRFRPGWYISMSFAIELLRKLAAHEEVNLQQDFSLSDLVKSLMERVMVKRSSWDLPHEVIALSMSVLVARSDDSDKVFSCDGGFLRSVVHCWSEKPDLFDDQMKQLLSLAPKRRLGLDEHYTPQDLGLSLISEVVPQLRYTLLRLLLLHASEPPRDIDVLEDLKNVHLVWPLSVFERLPSDHALSLLERLLKARPEQDFLSPGEGIFALPSSPDSAYADPQLLQLYLARSSDDTAEAAKCAVVRHQKKTTTAREPNDRAFSAKSALFNAIASEDLKLVGDVVLWMRRYIRDPLTAKSLYSTDVIGCCEGIDLLSGLPEKPAPGVSIQQLSHRVEQANNILLALFETACHALKEPSYHAPDWRGPLGMFGRVVEVRLKRVAAVSRDLDVSDDDLYRLLWSNTIDMLIHVEKIALEPDHGALNFNYLVGPLGGSGGGRNINSLKRLLPSSLRFIDNLARARDRLWQAHRPSVFPAVTTLSPPWPRGLPIQSLLNQFRINLESTDNLTPFMTSRAKEIVFLGSNVALCPINDSDEVQEAIGPFVDEYATALKIYVLQACSATDRQDRVDLAWKHALKELTGNRMTTNEATRFWRSQFVRALPESSLPNLMDDEEERMWPTLPKVEDVQQTEEWNPLVDQPARIQSRELSSVRVCIDCMLTAPLNPGPQLADVFSRREVVKEPVSFSRGIAQLTTAFKASPQKTIEFSQPRGIWNLHRFRNPRKLPRPIREGLVVSALLYLDSKKGGSRRILTFSSPSVDTAAQYPLLFLDEEFLLRNDLSELEALRVLEFYLDSIQPALLLDLATACIDELSVASSKSSKIVSLERITFRLVSLLAKCDQPALAADSIKNLILGNPNASSWHRKLLQPNFLRRLSPHHTRKFLVSLVMSIQTILEQQKLERERPRSRKEQIGILAAGNPSQPFIKVTTVKYLAQILHGADFITADVTVDILSRILESTDHIDVRVEVIQRILDTISSYSNDESQTLFVHRLITVMESTIALVGGPDERKCMTDIDWAAAEQGDTPPDVGEDSPILDMLLASLVLTRTSMKARQDMMRRVIWPIIIQSIETNAKWHEIFARKHSLDSAEVSHVSYPIRTDLPPNMLARYPEWVPLRLLQLYHGFLINNLLPSPDIQRINVKVYAEPMLRSSNEGQHWLSQHQDGSSASSAFAFVGFLTQEWHPSLLEKGVDEEGFQVRHVQDIAEDLSHRLLMIYDQEPYLWGSFIQKLAPPLGPYKRLQDLQPWIANGRPVVERLISLVEKTRSSKSWQDNPDRRPSVLPSNFGMTLWLLPYPCLQPSDMASPTRCALFAEQIVKQIEHLSTSRKPFRKELRELTAAAMRLSLEDRVRVGCEIGALGGEERTVAMADFLRLEVAEQLLEDASHVRDEDLRGLVSKIVKTWKSSGDEEIRRIGLGN